MQKENSITKFCNTCNTEKPVSEFYKRNGTINGYQSKCKDCMKKVHYEWTIKNPLRKKELQRKWKLKNPKSYWCNKTLNHHSNEGFKIVITKKELMKYIKNKDSCEICGKKLCFINTKTSHDSPSLDRVNNEQIITKLNIQLLCHQCNTTKGSRTQIEFEEYCKLILRRKGYDI